MAAEQDVSLKEISDMATLMKKWEEECSVAGYDPVPVLERMAEVIDAEMNVFNERHLLRNYHKSVLGQDLKVIFKKGNFMDKLVNDYLCDSFWTRSDGFPETHATDLNIAPIVIYVISGLEAKEEEDSLIIRLLNGAEKAQDPTFAVGLLAAAMEKRDTAAETYYSIISRLFNSKQLITKLVTYALLLMGNLHNSARYHATMFFAFSFQFRIILDEFDAQNGLCKLYNVIKSLEKSKGLYKDDETVVPAIVALKRYFEAHLSIKVEYHIMGLRQGTAERDLPITYRASRKTAEEVQEQIETLLSMMPFNASWVCVDQFQRLGGVALLIQIITRPNGWSFVARAEIVSVLAICCVEPKVQLSFCERLVLPNNTVTVGMKIILECCESKNPLFAEVQKAALYVIINCVCAPTDRANEGLLQKIRGSVRENNGIFVLLKLMMMKKRIPHAYGIRALACRALSGLARCEKVHQIVSKLPALSNESMKVALDVPILHEKRQEHVLFQKYYLELIDLITGKNQRTTCDDVSLHSIIMEYLTNQHALCKNPMVTCPRFNIFVPHKCPEPKKQIEAPVNHVMRLISRQTGFLVSNSMNNILDHSRFSLEKTIRASPDCGYYCSCCYIPNTQYLVAGTNWGKIHVHNIHNGALAACYKANESAVYHTEASRNGNLLLTSSWSDSNPECGLWRCNHHPFEVKTIFDDVKYVEFSKWNQDRVVGTNGANATIFDIETGQKISTFNPILSNTYSKNRATFNPSDELILTDGVLFDVRSGREIHKLDKLNSVLSGVFHPNRLEILSNTEVWDLRTFHLLRTVQALDQKEITFNSTGSVVYTYKEKRKYYSNRNYTSFQTLDLRDYSSIATIDTKKSIYNIACNVHDSQIAVASGTAIQLYAVGRCRDTEDKVE